MKPKKIFETVAKNNIWGDKDSKSGPGSNLEQTALICEELPKLLKTFKIKSMLDAPCGDFFWMKEIISKINSQNCSYIGADIVPDLIKENNLKFGADDKRFLALNLIEDAIPKADLILTRDCFIHLSYQNIFKILANYKKSNSKYLLCSTYIYDSRKNKNVKDFYIYGRALNMQKFPFYFSKPLDLINENCTEDEGAYNDKSLGLWELKNISLNTIYLCMKLHSLKLYFWRLKHKIKNKIKN